MLTGLRELGINALDWTRDARDLQARMELELFRLERAGAVLFAARSSSAPTPREM